MNFPAKKRIIPILAMPYHQESKDHNKGHLPISDNPAEWQKEWNTIFYKTYPRLPKIKLSDKYKNNDIFNIIQTRRSAENFSGESITLDEISTLSKYAFGRSVNTDGKIRRPYPSAGTRYPIEIYFLIPRPNATLDPGLYHYNLREHAFHILLPQSFDKGELVKLFSHQFVQHASIIIILTAVFWRTQNKYGERGYRYILLEAGHIGQNIYLVSEALGLKCCALGGTNDEEIEKLIDIDGVTESLVYAVAVGK